MSVLRAGRGTNCRGDRRRRSTYLCVVLIVVLVVVVFAVFIGVLAPVATLVVLVVFIVVVVVVVVNRGCEGGDGRGHSRHLPEFRSQDTSVLRSPKCTTCKRTFPLKRCHILCNMYVLSLVQKPMCATNGKRQK